MSIGAPIASGPPIPALTLPHGESAKVEFEKSPNYKFSLKGMVMLSAFGLGFLAGFGLLLTRFWFLGLGIWVVELALLLLKR